MGNLIHTLKGLAEPFRIAAQPFRIGGCFVRKGSDFQGGNFPILDDFAATSASKPTD
jgi:hypothetical protein